MEEAIMAYLLCLIGDRLHVNSPLEESEQQVLQLFECLTESLQSLLHCLPCTRQQEHNTGWRGLTRKQGENIFVIFINKGVGVASPLKGPQAGLQ